MLYLRSDQADQNTHGADKTWIISPMWTRGKYHNLVVRSLQIMHLFPNVKKTVILNTGKKVVTIPVGNYTPDCIASYLQNNLYSELVQVCWDPSTAVFRFHPGINIEPDSTIAPLLGFQRGVQYKGATESVLPANVYGPQRITVDTNLQLYNIPTSGRLCTIPVKETYGQVIHYNNYSATHQHLCMDPHFQTIRIRLIDEDGDLLTAYDETPWYLDISFEIIENPGFQAHIIL